jgi:hypothetical protein
MTTLYTVTITLATDEDPSTLLDEAMEVAKQLGERVETTSDEDDIEQSVCVSEYKDGDAGVHKPRAVGVNVDVEDERIAHLLCNAFEGGSGYWARIEDYRKPTDLDDLTPALDMDQIFPHIDYPLSDDGAVILRAMDDSKDLVLDREAVERGLKVMATKYERHWANFIRQNDDAITGDVFLQCCVLGELVYG